MRLRMKMTLMQVATVVLAIGALCWVFIQQVSGYAETEMEAYRQEKLSEEKLQLKDFVQMAVGTIENYSDRARDIEGLKKAKQEDLKRVVDAVSGQVEAYYERNRNVMSQAELVAGLADIVLPARFDGDNYVWLQNLDSVILVHPSDKLMGKDMSRLTDVKGNRVIAEMSRIAAEQGTGMSTYWWPKPGEDEPKLKISYVRLLPESGIVVGSGAWIEDITAEMKAEALKQLSGMRLTDGNYFWVNDLTPKMVMHPIKPALDGQDVGAMTDTKGKHLFREMVSVAKAEGEGYVDYHWGKPGKEGDFPKLSFVKLFKEWGWVVGMGVYIDDIDAAVAADRPPWTRPSPPSCSLSCSSPPVSPCWAWLRAYSAQSR